MRPQSAQIAPRRGKAVAALVVAGLIVSIVGGVFLIRLPAIVDLDREVKALGEAVVALEQTQAEWRY